MTTLRRGRSSADGDSVLSRAGENRVITAVFYDIVGSTELLSALDPEDFRDTQQAVHAAAARVIRSHGGYLGHIQGDGGYAYFGYPTAQENAIEQAIAAALSIIDACGGISAPGGKIKLAIRVGVATDEAIVGGEPPDGIDELDQIVGRAPALAARLQSVAEANSVIVNRRAWIGARNHFTCQPVSLPPLKGFGDVNTGYRITGRRQIEKRFSALRTSSGALLGRDAELNLARHCWREAKAGRGGVLVIDGEPGIGKSRLLAELWEEARADGADVRHFQCVRQSRLISLHPLFERFIRDDAGGSVTRRSLDYRRVIRALKRIGVADSGDRDALALLIGVSAPELEYLQDTAHERLYHDAIRAIERTVQGWAVTQPQLLALEDAQWADPSTLDLLVSMVAWLTDHPILLVVTTRSTEILDWLGETGVVRLALSRVGREATKAIARQTFEAYAVVVDSAEVYQAISDRSDGIPLFIEELACLLVDEASKDGRLEDHWSATLQRSASAGLADILAARIDALGPDKPVATAAAVIGRAFSGPLLVALCAPAIDAKSVEAAVLHMLQAGIVRRSRLSGAVGYLFRHALIQDAAHGLLLRRQQRDLHRRIVDLLGDNPDLAPWISLPALADHAERAEDFERAVRLLIPAGEQASARSAIHEARRLLDRGLELADRISDDEARAVATLSIISALGPVLTSLEGTASSRAQGLYERGVELCRPRPPGERARWFPIYWGWWYTGGDFAEQRRRAAVAVSDLQDVDDDEVRLQARHCLWAIDFNIGDHRACIRSIEAGLAVYRADVALRQRTLYGGHDARVCGLGQKGLSLWLTGRAREGEASVLASVAWAEEIGHVPSLAHALDICAMFAKYAANLDLLAATTKRMRALAEENGLTSLAAKCQLFDGWGTACRGDPREGRRMMQAGLAIQREIGTREDFPVYSEMLAEVCGLANMAADGLECVAEAIAEAERTGHRYWLAELHRRRALLHHAASAPVIETIGDLEHALAVATEQSARALALRALATLAEVDETAFGRVGGRAAFERLVTAMEPTEEVRSLAAGSRAFER